MRCAVDAARRRTRKIWLSDFKGPLGVHLKKKSVQPLPALTSAELRVCLLLTFWATRINRSVSDVSARQCVAHAVHVVHCGGTRCVGPVMDVPALREQVLVLSDWDAGEDRRCAARSRRHVGVTGESLLNKPVEDTPVQMSAR